MQIDVNKSGKSVPENFQCCLSEFFLTGNFTSSRTTDAPTTTAATPTVRTTTPTFRTTPTLTTPPIPTSSPGQ